MGQLIFTNHGLEGIRSKIAVPGGMMASMRGALGCAEVRVVGEVVPRKPAAVDITVSFARGRKEHCGI